MADLVHDSRDLPYTYKGESTVIPEVTGDYCPACGEVVLDAAESARTSAAMLEFNKQVNASIVDPAFIARVRKKLAPDSRRMVAKRHELIRDKHKAAAVSARHAVGVKARDLS
jgi:HTH-type transcriptional regulator/antitoxin MqsA